MPGPCVNMFDELGYGLCIAVRPILTRPLQHVGDPPIAPRPELGRSIPAITMIKLVFPEPEGPTRLTVSPAAISSPMSRRMSTGPAGPDKVRCTSSKATRGSVKWNEAVMLREPSEAPTMWRLVDLLQ